MDTFKPGDIVRLKSGGPDLTVKGKMANTTSFVCQWFVAGGKLEQGIFVPDALVPVEGSDKPAVPKGE